MADAGASSQEQYGFERLGPIVAYFLHDLEGVLERLAGQRGGRALFVSRGGLMIREAFDVYRTAVGIAPPAHEAPFYVSRFLAAKGAWRRAPERALAVLDREFGPATAETYLRRLDPSLEAPAAGGRVYGSFSEFIGQDGPLQRRGREYLDAQAALFERYVSGLLDGYPLGVLVDTGWQGTIQSLITHTFPEREIWGVNFGRYGAGMDPAVAGRLFGLGFTGDVYDERRPLTAITHHRHLVEALFEPVGDSIEALQDVGGQVAPVGAEPFSRDRLSPGAPALFSGVLRYLREAAGDQSYAALVRARDLAAKTLAEDILFPTRDTARLIGGFSRSVDFGRRDSVGVLVDPAGSDAGPEARIRAALWKQGQIALECRPAIARERQRMLLPKRGSLQPEPAEARAWDPAAPKVAIIMRTMDRMIFLSRAFESIARQTFDDYVLVVFNDGGDVAGVEAELAESRLDRRKVIVLDGLENRGMEAASNAAIRHVSSEYIVIHDDDDSWVQGFLARTVAYLDANRSAAGVVTLSAHVLEEISGDRVEVKARVPYNEKLRTVQLGQLLSGNLYPPISFLFRRSHYDLVGGFNESLPVLGDWDFNIKVAARAEIGVIPEILANYHYREARDGGAYSNSIVGGADLHARYNAVVRQSLLDDERLKHLAGAIAIAPLLRRLVPASPDNGAPGGSNAITAVAGEAPGQPGRAQMRRPAAERTHGFPPIATVSDERLSHNLISKAHGLRLTWIPKNMCSTLKLSFAVAGGLVSPAQVSSFLAQPWRIHSWVAPLEPLNLPDLETPHSVAVVREPSSRLRSTLVEKALFQDEPEFRRVVLPLLQAHAGDAPRAVEAMTIEDLLEALRRSPDEEVDQHWKSQVGFLSGAYDTLLPMARPADVAAFFASYGIELVTVDHHATSRTRGEPLALSLDDGVFAARRAMGGLMRPVRFSADLERRIEEVVAERFAADLTLWRSVTAAE